MRRRGTREQPELMAASVLRFQFFFGIERATRPESGFPPFFTPFRRDFIFFAIMRERSAPTDGRYGGCDALFPARERGSKKVKTLSFHVLAFRADGSLVLLLLALT